MHKPKWIWQNNSLKFQNNNALHTYTIRRYNTYTFWYSGKFSIHDKIWSVERTALYTCKQQKTNSNTNANTKLKTMKFKFIAVNQFGEWEIETGWMSEWVSEWMNEWFSFEIVAIRNYIAIWYRLSIEL